MTFDIVVAYDSKLGISCNGTIPWLLPADLRFFKELTTGNGYNVVIMGRKTYESIGKPLVKRTNLILTRQPIEDFHDGEEYLGYVVSNSLDSALSGVCCVDAEDVFVIGGEQVYKEALKHPDLRWVYVTHIEKDFKCNKHFILNDCFRVIDFSDKMMNNGLEFRFLRYERFR